MANNDKIRIASQERALAEAQKNLDRIERMRAEMAKRVEQEMKKLEAMRGVTEDFTKGEYPDITPSLSSSAPTGFESQYDKFSGNTRLRRVGDPKSNNDNFTGTLPPPNDEANKTSYRTSDRDEHFTELETHPGYTIYVSGKYLKGKDGKEYEYILGEPQLPVKIGDVVDAPVHTRNYHRGIGAQKEHKIEFEITDIYTQRKFTKYDDDIIW